MIYFCKKGWIMKTRLFLKGIVALTIMMSVLSASYGDEKAGSASETKCLKIGIVSVRKIFQDCKRNVKYRQELAEERDKMEMELEKLSKEIDLNKTNLRALKPGSSDYSALMKEIFEKQGRLQAQQEFYKRQMDIRENQVIESLFKDVIKAVGEIAKEKGFDLVLERSEPDMPAANSNELTLTISTYKVLFDAGCEDITEAVLAKVDAAGN
jgi:outer membrane protein